MNASRTRPVSTFVVALLMLLSGMTPVWAQKKVVQPTPSGSTNVITTGKMRGTTNEQRKAAAERLRQKRAAQARLNGTKTTSGTGLHAMAAMASVASPFTPCPVGTPGGTPDYFGCANFANSPLPIVDAVVNISDPTGVGASASPIIYKGVIIGFSVDNGGSGYTAPTVTITSNSGSGASATASVAGGSITAINLASGGAGYAITGGLRKFVDQLPSIPFAVADTVTYPNSDFYQLGIKDFQQQMHSDLPVATQLRGYYQINSGTDATGNNTIAPPTQSYLGPFIIAQKNRPVRVQLINTLPTGTAGNLFIPVDTSLNGTGTGPNGGSELYTQNRATIHLHGGNTPWITDGTPHQWITPAGENTSYPKGFSFQNVPDMVGTGYGQVANTATDGQATYYWTNQQSSRLMWYHDHSFGITRLNVYVGEVAGYLLVDPAEEDALAAAGVPGTVGSNPDLAHLIPLIIQDKTFVPPADQLAAEDPTWNWLTTGNLWFPHVYTPNQNPADPGGVNPYGRWDYGPWFWPPYLGMKHGGVQCPPPYLAGTECPGVPDISLVPEAFMDTPVVNGMAYPQKSVDPTAYRFQVLNGANDRYFNLNLYYAMTPNGTICRGAAALPSDCTEVSMVPAVRTPTFPPYYATDGRLGGVPNPTTAGPDIIQIGTEAGILPVPADIPATPISYDPNPRSVTIGNVLNHGLLLGPAERADFVVDFSQVTPGSTLILYNDAPAPVPGFDSRLDYWTGDPDQTSTGGAPTTQPGYGPNTRTVMQFVVNTNVTPATNFSLAALNSMLPSVYALSQPAPIVPEAAFGQAYNTNFANTYSMHVGDNTITYTPIGSTTPVTANILPKAIQELFETDYGRMNATLGVELPFTNMTNQTTIPMNYVDPITETVKDGETQFWKIVHNGVDTHSIHFHLVNVQVINRIGWDGTVRPPDANEVGWKEVVRMNPLENIIIAARAVKQTLPWPIPDSIRPLDTTAPIGSTGQFSNIDPNGVGITTRNTVQNFGWEYVWHCHILGHEENDMMRTVVFQVPPEAPSNLAYDATQSGVNMTWLDNSVSETGFTVQSALDAAFTRSVVSTNVSANPGYNTNVAFHDANAGAAGIGTYYYRVQAYKPDAAYFGPGPNLVSAWSNTIQISEAPVAVYSVASLAFGNQGMQTTSAAKTITLVNQGNMPLTVSGLVFTGTNPGDFAQTNSCGTPIAVGSSCVISVKFTPATMGNRSATLTVTSNDPANTAYAISLTGVGLGPIAGVNPTSLAFGGQVINTASAAQTVVLSNTGNGALTISSIRLTGTNASYYLLTNPCSATLNAGATCVLSVAFKPLTAIASTAALTIASNDPLHPTLTVNLTGTGSNLQASPTSLTFGNQLVGTRSTAQVITLSNFGATNITVNAISFTGTNAADFAQTNTCGNRLQAGRTCTISVTFQPAAMGSRTASLSFASSDPTSPKLIALTGTGIAPIAGITPTSLSFSSALNTTTTAQAVTLSNTGTAPLVISSMSLTGLSANQFAQTNNCGASLAAGSTCAINITFRPTSAGSKTAALSVAVAAPGISQTVALTGTVPAGVLSLTPVTVNFGTVRINTTSTATAISVSNTGAASLTITSYTFAGTGAGQFAQTNNCPATLAVGASCTVNVTFRPTTTGGKSATLNVNVASPAVSQSVTLAGTGR